jgi:hypothetical protein
MNRSRIILIIAGLILVGILIAISVFTSVKQAAFHTVSKGPINTATYAQQVIITFNSDLDQASKDRFTILPLVNGQSTISDQKYTVKLAKPKSTSGITGADVSFSFTINDTQFAQLPAAEQERQMAGTDANETRYPITQDVPYETDEYSIDYTFDPNGKPVFQIQLFGITSGRHTVAENLAVLKTQQAAVYAFFASHNTDPAQYELDFTPNPANGLDETLRLMPTK